MNDLNDFEKAVKSLLDKRAETDSLFRTTYAKPNKNIRECCQYIFGTVYERAKNQHCSYGGRSGCSAAVSDEEVVGMAVHYYDEDDIKIPGVSASVSTSVASNPSTKSTGTKRKAKSASSVAPAPTAVAASSDGVSAISAEPTTKTLSFNMDGDKVAVRGTLTSSQRGELLKAGAKYDLQKRCFYVSLDQIQLVMNIVNGDVK